METLISKLKTDKIKIQWNDNPVPMDLFKSFISVDLEISRDHLGSSTGWTKCFNLEHKLFIGGGIYKGVNWLDSIQYGKNLHNPYNNFVTPFHLNGIITKEGVDFFKEYYKKEIEIELLKVKSDIGRFEQAVINLNEKLKSYQSELELL